MAKGLTPVLLYFDISLFESMTFQKDDIIQRTCPDNHFFFFAIHLLASPQSGIILSSLPDNNNLR